MAAFSLKLFLDEVERIHEWDTKKLAGTAKECYTSNFTVEYRNN